MKNFISKIKNRRLKGNVSLLVIFVLLASSVIALLSINQIQRLLTYWNMTFNYFRAFYLAKAWTELWLTEVYHREAWFEQTINSWDSIVRENLVWNYVGFNPYFTMNISWNFLYLTDDVRYTNECNDNNKITLANWEGIVLSLFRDGTSWVVNSLTLTNESNIKRLDNNIIKELKIENPTSEGINFSDLTLTFWLFDYDENSDMKNIVVDQLKHTSLDNFLSKIDSFDRDDRVNRRYFTIKNHLTWGEVVSFCITINDKKLIPYSDSLITVRGNYGDMEVGLQSVVKKQSPSWSLNVLGDNY